jgi:hypothetical protein
MDSSSNSSTRRSEDIALDLLKFVAAHANLGRTASSAPGFGVPSAAKADDTLNQIFELYARCREAVESPTPATEK